MTYPIIICLVEIVKAGKSMMIDDKIVQQIVIEDSATALASLKMDFPNHCAVIICKIGWTPAAGTSKRPQFGVKILPSKNLAKFFNQFNWKQKFANWF